MGELAITKERDRYSWTQVSLPRKEEAKRQVSAILAEEGIPAVPAEKIGRRLQKAIKDIQRSRL